VVIDGITTDECPKSVILRSPESCELVQIFNQAHTVKGALGPPAQWPGAMYDAVSLLTDQRAIDRNAQQSAKN
jgi:hypothetical protein